MGVGQNRNQSSPAEVCQSPEQKQFRLLLAQADRLWEIGRIEDTIKLLHQAEAIAPQNGGVQACLGHLYDQAKNSVKALKHLQAAIALNPEDGYAHRIRACVLCEAGRLDEALKAAEMAVRYETEVADSSLVLVQMLVRKGEFGRAKQVAARMRSRWPGTVMVHWCLGLIASQELRWADAEMHYRRALKLQPEDSLTLNSLGVALQRQGKREEARQTYLRAVVVDPNNAEAQRNMGRTMHLKPDDPAYNHLPREVKEEYVTAHQRKLRRSHNFLLAPVVAALLYIHIFVFQRVISISVPFSLVTLIILCWTVMAAAALTIYGRFAFPPRPVWQFNCIISAFVLSTWSYMWAREASLGPSSFNGFTLFLSLSLLLLLSSYKLVFTSPSVLRFQERKGKAVVTP